MKRRYLILCLSGLSVLGACKAEKPEVAAAVEAEVEVAATKARMKTCCGDIVIQLDLEKAPISSKNFIKYVNAKHYDGTVFHRVINGFMIQGGGFAKEGTKLIEKKTGDGIQNEGQNGLLNEIGTIAMARTQDPNSATAQFFINVAKNGALDYPSNGGYAVFGKVIEGMDVVNKIKARKTTTKELTMRHPVSGEKITMPSPDVPEETVVIESVTME